MCGIGGIIKVTPAGEAAAAALAVPPREAIPEAWLDVLDESIRHRGPDGQGRFRDRVVRADGSVVDVALVHRRLSIIDHGGGAQPMVSVLGGPELGGPALRAGRAASPARGAMRPLLFHGKPNAAVVYDAVRGTGPGNTGILPADSSGGTDVPPMDSQEHGQDAHATDLVAVVFNGCIYNHRDLRRELQSAGHEFRTDHSDTEVLLHGWREWGERLFENLDGMYALAIWDRLAASLVIARDWFGEKPLYTIETDRGGAGVKALCTAVPGLLNLGAHGVQGVDAMSPMGVQSISPWVKFGWNQVPPAWNPVELCIGSSQFLSGQTPSDAPISSDRFAHLSAAMNPIGSTLSVDALDRMLEASVAARLESDVPIGCFLSGGIDSSLIARYAHLTRPDVAAFTVRMPTARFDESPVAGRVARHIGMRHQVLECQPAPAADLVALIQQLGLPFGDSSLLPSHWVSRAAREVARVALGGDGGDDLFMGYDRHKAIRWLRWLDALPRESRRALAGAVAADANPRSTRTRLSRLINASAHDGYKELVAIFAAPFDEHLGLRGQGEHGWNAIQPFGMTCEGSTDRFGALNASTAMALRFDRLFYLPCDILRKTDTASMSVALEVRAPFLDHTLALAAMNAPVSCLMPRGQRKGLLRQVARKYFPAEIVDRPKQGFAIPIGEWFRSDYGGMKQLLMDHLNSAEPWGPPRLGIELNMKFVRQMVDEHMNEQRDHSQRLYMLLVLSIWAKWMGSLGG
ncbi:MAG: asparagine synthase (glutamine-hydrolyzing) [Phycisphaeraceae bacterium]|nr:asparagine synthase (glutamine-hydrolyzing) [Phycisphaeraceae bacterium]